MADDRVTEIILDRLDKIDTKIDKIESKISYFAGFFTAVGAVSSLAGAKLYNFFFG